MPLKKRIRAESSINLINSLVFSIDFHILLIKLKGKSGRKVKSKSWANPLQASVHFTEE